MFRDCARDVSVHVLPGRCGGGGSQRRWVQVRGVKEGPPRTPSLLGLHILLCSPQPHCTWRRGHPHLGVTSAQPGEARPTFLFSSSLLFLPQHRAAV